MKKTGQGFMFFLIGEIFGSPRSNWKWCQINVYSWWLCKVCQSRSFSDLHFRGVGARWAEWASIMVIWVVEFSIQGSKIRNILGQKSLLSCKWFPTSKQYPRYYPRPYWPFISKVQFWHRYWFSMLAIPMSELGKLHFTQFWYRYWFSVLAIPMSELGKLHFTQFWHRYWFSVLAIPMSELGKLHFTQFWHRYWFSVLFLIFY